MKHILPFLQGSLAELSGLVLLMLVYWWATQLAVPPSGKELHLLEAAREAVTNHHFFYPTYNETVLVPVSPLLTVFVSLIFKFFATTILTARTLILVLSFVSLLLFYVLGSRIFHPTVGLLSTGFMIASWGFFTNSHMANGAMLYLLLMIISFMLFFHWFDIAFRSRTFAKSLYVHFSMLGFTLGMAFCTLGIPGLLFPLLVMLTSIVLSKRPEILKDIQYTWLLVPLGVIILLWLILGSLSVGFLTFISTLFPLQAKWQLLAEPLIYLLPVLPLILPAVLSKDIWNRGFISYQKRLCLMFAWLIWSLIFLGLFGSFHEVFALMAIAPVILWLGFYLSEVFRNPLFPFSLQLTLDFMIILALATSVCCIILTMQVVPPQLVDNFVLLTFALPGIAILLLLLRDFTISRLFPAYVIPFSLLLCILAKGSLVSLLEFHPAQELASTLSMEKLQQPHSSILEWSPHQDTPSIIRFSTPLENKVKIVSHQAELESAIQTREGPLYLILPESVFYNLPPSVRESGYVLSTSWQWKQPINVFVLFKALKNEMLTFAELSEPVFLFEMPVNPEDM